jgi:putative ABC transport system ATP-binding protein
VLGEDRSAKSLLLRVLAGLTRPSKGVAELAGVDSRDAGLAAGGRIVGYAGPIEIFHATLVENVSLGRTGVGRNRVQETLRSVGLWNDVLNLPQGAATMLQTGGYPLTPSQASLVLIARAIAASPSVLLIDGLLDDLLPGELEQVWQAIASPDCPWTLLVATDKDRIAERCDDRVSVRSAAASQAHSHS